MKTLKITLDDTPQAALLAEMLQGLTFVKSVEDTSASSVLTSSPSEKMSSQRDRIRQHLLEAPTLSEDELSVYVENRKYLNQWRTK